MSQRMLRGNLAVRPEPKTRVVKRTRIVRAGLSMGEKLFYLLCLAVTIGAAAYLISLYGMSAAINYEVQELRHHLEEERERTVQMRVDLEKRSTAEIITSKAQELGMSFSEDRLVVLPGR
ncbi:MAG: hypothetical protein C0P68_001870 [Bacillota bacterium]|nr:hypothetical protein [Bacillota bacterium]